MQQINYLFIFVSANRASIDKCPFLCIFPLIVLYDMQVGGNDAVSPSKPSRKRDGRADTGKATPEFVLLTYDMMI